MITRHPRVVPVGLGIESEYAGGHKHGRLFRRASIILDEVLYPPYDRTVEATALVELADKVIATSVAIGLGRTARARYIHKVPTGGGYHGIMHVSRTGEEPEDLSIVAVDAPILQHEFQDLVHVGFNMATRKVSEVGVFKSSNIKDEDRPELIVARLTKVDHFIVADGVNTEELTGQMRLGDDSNAFAYLEETFPYGQMPLRLNRPETHEYADFFANVSPQDLI